MAKKQSNTIYPLHALRAVAIHAQHLDTPNGAEPAPTLDRIYEVVEALGMVQIDTLHMVNRAHYLALWARLGSYSIDDFHKLIYDPEHRKLYEYWGHAASIMPLAHYKYQMWKMDKYRSSPGTWFSRWLEQDGNRELVQSVLTRIRDQGAMRGGDFEYDGPKRGSWWDWKPSKLALEMLFEQGELMVTDRVKFQRVYDIPDRVLPDWVERTPTQAEDAHRFHIELAAKALGVFEPKMITDYAYMKVTTVKPFIASMLKSGELVEIQGETLNGVKPLAVHRDLLPKLQQAADGALKAQRTTFLNPFDSLFWAYDRDEQFWGFKQTLEAYVKAPNRKWGYYTMPVLRNDELIGRFDPKLERKTGNLILRALYLQDGIEPDDALIADVATAMRDFMAWHEATTLTIEKSVPAAFGKKLKKAL
jgi:uncharacterized protein